MKLFAVLGLALTLSVAGQAAAGGFGAPPTRKWGEPTRSPAPQYKAPTPQTFGAPPVYPATRPRAEQAEQAAPPDPKPFKPYGGYKPYQPPKSYYDGSVFLPPGEMDSYSKPGGRKNRPRR